MGSIPTPRGSWPSTLLRAGQGMCRRNLPKRSRSDARRKISMSHPSWRTSSIDMAAAGRCSCPCRYGERPEMAIAPQKTWRPADSLVDPVGRQIIVFPDREMAGNWRVEYEDDDGGCYVVIFSGPHAERRARAYFEAAKNGTIEL